MQPPGAEWPKNWTLLQCLELSLFWSPEQTCLSNITYVTVCSLKYGICEERSMLRVNQFFFLSSKFSYTLTWENVHTTADSSRIAPQAFYILKNLGESSECLETILSIFLQVCWRRSSNQTKKWPRILYRFKFPVSLFRAGRCFQMCEQTTQY